MGVIFALYVMGSLAVIAWVSVNAKEERRELEDRLMAFTDPEALILHKAQEKPIEAEISYVDDETRDDDDDGS